MTNLSGYPLIEKDVNAITDEATAGNCGHHGRRALWGIWASAAI